MTRGLVLTWLAACAAGTAAMGEQPGPDVPIVDIVIQADLDRPGPEFEGWGTALAWFANVTGAWPGEDRERLADLFYGDDGLRWNIGRYNIGGGNHEDAPPYLRPGADVPGFWQQPPGARGRDWWRPDREDMWDWSRDAAQRWWLDAISNRVDEPVFEAFSNSPPWFMTVSGLVSGARLATDDNLREGFEKPFAAYLARVVDELQQRHGIVFRTLSPVNEPNTTYWYAANRQEGTRWSPERQAMIIDTVYEALAARELETVIAAPDETNSHLFLVDWAAWPGETRARIGQLNVHSYGTVHQTGVRDIARFAGIRLWMSENDTPLEKDPENFEGMASALAFAEHIVMDLKRLEPSAWVFWQAVEDLSARNGRPGSNWGLVKADLRAAANGPHPVYVTRKYWAMAQFSRFIRPGYRLIPVNDPDTVGALSADDTTLVLVHVNGGLLPRRLKLPDGWQEAMVVTDEQRDLRPVPGNVVPPRSIATLVLSRPDVL